MNTPSESKQVKIEAEGAALVGLQAVVRMLELAAYKIWDCVLVGNPAPKIAELFEEMQHPKPGDLVIETSTLYGAKMRNSDGKMEPRGIAGIGYLIKIEREPTWNNEQAKLNGWNIAEDGPIPTEKVIYMKLLDGREFRWTNADVLKVPIDLAS